jgi:hypothetical protein
MKKDIKIPEVKDVYIALVKEKVDNSNTSEWSVYIINTKEENLDLVIIVSEGFSKTKKTSTLRKTIKHLPQKSYAKVEILQESLIKFTNLFKVSFFKDNQIFDKTFTFQPNTIIDENLVDIPLIKNKGILAE